MSDNLSTDSGEQPPQSQRPDIDYDLSDAIDRSFDLEGEDLAERYEIIRPLGKEGMVETYLARNQTLRWRDEVVIKRVRNHAGWSQTAIDGFLAKVRALTESTRYSISEIYECGQLKDGDLYLITNYLDGSSLSERCRDHGLSLEDAFEWIDAICEDLKMVHIAGIVHRDIRPDNIFITSKGTAILTGYRLAEGDEADIGLTLDGIPLPSFPSSQDFMSPEQKRDATQSDARCDIWSLAATFRQMLKSHYPKETSSPKITVDLQSVLDKAMSEHPKDRFQSAVEFAESLRTTNSSFLDRLYARVIGKED